MLIKAFPKYTQCWKDAPTDKLNWFKFALYSGLVFKLSGSSSFDSNLDLYNNPKYSNDTVAMMRVNYRPDVSTGFYTMYSMANEEESNLRDETKLLSLLKQGGGERVISDNVPRVLKFLKKNSDTKEEGPRCAAGYRVVSSSLLAIPLLLLFTFVF